MPNIDVRLNRRALVAASGAGIAAGTIPALIATGQTPVATPDASPPAGIEQVALYQELRDGLIGRGRAFLATLFEGDDEAFAAQISPELAGVFAGLTTTQFLATLETNQVQLTSAQLGAWISGHFDGSGQMGGLFFQGQSAPFLLETSETQTGEVPTGTWAGVLGPGIVDLAFEVTFSGSVEDFRASLSVPSQGIENLPFDSAEFVTEIPIGDLLDEDGLPFLPATSAYRAAYTWGDAILVFNANESDAGVWNALNLETSLPLPPDPAADITSAVEYQLPADTQMLVGWGGDTVFRNYHAASPAQRHANDILVWRDGGTCPPGAGLENADYFIWGVPMLAPAAGIVAGVLDEFPDILPAINPDHAASLPSGPVHACGNHVVIEVAESEYVFLCHMQEGTIRVAAGDRVEAGDEVGLVGNSGNTTEPHIHIHVQSSPDMFDPAAIGLPLVYHDLRLNAEAVDEAVATQGSFIEPA